jgi:peptidoglycan/LPS O-acetylase OafA/YrhL
VWIAIGALLLRCMLAAYGADSWTLYSNTACRMDALALGGAGACVLRTPALRDAARKRQSEVAAAALLVFLAGIPLTHSYDNGSPAGETFGYSLLALSSAAFVTWVAMLAGRAPFGVRWLLNWAPLRSCGKYSYAMCVFHMVLHQLVGEPWLIAQFGKLTPLPLAFVYGLAVFLISVWCGVLHLPRAREALPQTQAVLRQPLTLRYGLLSDVGQGAFDSGGGIGGEAEVPRP